jgi:hypothetical protein
MMSFYFKILKTLRIEHTQGHRRGWGWGIIADDFDNLADVVIPKVVGILGPVDRRKELRWELPIHSIL